MLLEEGVCYDQYILLAKLLAFALLHFVLQSQTCLLLQVSFSQLPTFAWAKVIQMTIISTTVGKDPLE